MSELHLLPFYKYNTNIWITEVNGRAKDDLKLHYLPLAITFVVVY